MPRAEPPRGWGALSFGRRRLRAPQGVRKASPSGRVAEARVEEVPQPVNSSKEEKLRDAPAARGGQPGRFARGEDGHHDSPQRRYLFWDGAHPTTGAHALLADAVLEEIL